MLYWSAGIFELDMLGYFFFIFDSATLVFPWLV